jgi:hypothetical protein
MSDKNEYPQNRKRNALVIVPFGIGALALGILLGLYLPEDPIVFVFEAVYIVGGLPAVLLATGTNLSQKK